MLKEETTSGIGEADRVGESKQNSSRSKSYQGERKRNTERNRDGTARTVMKRNEDQSQY